MTVTFPPIETEHISFIGVTVSIEGNEEEVEHLWVRIIEPKLKPMVRVTRDWKGENNLNYR